jgi:hypothetical protein
MTVAVVDRALLVSKIEAAKRDVMEAEVEIEGLISHLRATARAEKTTIGQTLETAFKKLRAARSTLEALERHLLANDRTSP